MVCSVCQAEKCRKVGKQEPENLKNLNGQFERYSLEKETQIAIGSKRIKKTSIGTQTPSFAERCDKESQCGLCQGNYGWDRVHQRW